MVSTKTSRLCFSVISLSWFEELFKPLLTSLIWILCYYLCKQTYVHYYFKNGISVLPVESATTGLWDCEGWAGRYRSSVLREHSAVGQLDVTEKCQRPAVSRGVTDQFKVHTDRWCSRNGKKSLGTQHFVPKTQTTVICLHRNCPYHQIQNYRGIF